MLSGEEGEWVGRREVEEEEECQGWSHLRRASASSLLGPMQTRGGSPPSYTSGLWTSLGEE